MSNGTELRDNDDVAPGVLDSASDDIGQQLLLYATGLVLAAALTDAYF